MKISVSEFRDMLEQHSQEIRQAQEDYNTMADEKDEEIKQLEKKLNDTLTAFKEFKDHCLVLTRSILDGGPVRGAMDLMQESYEARIDGLDGY